MRGRYTHTHTHRERERERERETKKKRRRRRRRERVRGARPRDIRSPAVYWNGAGSKAIPQLLGHIVIVDRVVDRDTELV